MLDLAADPESVLREVLSRDEFRESSLQTLLDRFYGGLYSAIQHALSWIAKHWPKIGPLPENYEIFWTLMGLAFYATVLGLVVAGIVFLIRRVILPKWAQQTTSDAGTAGDSAQEVVPAVPSHDAALALALQGRYREALMVLFRFVLLQLHERGVVKLHPSWTNREILDQVPAQNLIKTPLTEMTTQFNAVRYGGMPCGKDDFDRSVRLAEELTRGN